MHVQQQERCAKHQQIHTKDQQMHTEDQQMHTEDQQMHTEHQPMFALLQQMSAHQQKMDAQQQKMDAQQQKMDAQQQKMNAQQQKMDTQQQKTNAQLQKIETQQQKMDVQQQQLNVQQQQILAQEATNHDDMESMMQSAASSIKRPEEMESTHPVYSVSVQQQPLSSAMTSVLHRQETANTSTQRVADTLSGDNDYAEPYEVSPALENYIPILRELLMSQRVLQEQQQQMMHSFSELKEAQKDMPASIQRIEEQGTHIAEQVETLTEVVLQQGQTVTDVKQEVSKAVARLQRAERELRNQGQALMEKGSSITLATRLSQLDHLLYDSDVSANEYVNPFLPKSSGDDTDLQEKLRKWRELRKAILKNPRSSCYDTLRFQFTTEGDGDGDGDYHPFKSLKVQDIHGDLDVLMQNIQGDLDVLKQARCEESCAHNFKSHSEIEKSYNKKAPCEIQHEIDIALQTLCITLRDSFHTDSSIQTLLS